MSYIEMFAQDLKTTVELCLGEVDRQENEDIDRAVEEEMSRRFFPAKTREQALKRMKNRGGACDIERNYFLIKATYAEVKHSLRRLRSTCALALSADTPFKACVQVSSDEAHLIECWGGAR
ncbi:hypothetical protein [Kushneria phosphatilytica]|uniref:Uncharacterized protein n=1 Tax=Kushneria phosphatilytica TaxID=657387 RepID=A0A5C0ZZN5_9GAMM|nr:hypothetical protein [Kushneria phosphatilytica]QEL11346.1 hypothetical protein FY550_09475 [Kushneria phosphatilytica]